MKQCDFWESFLLSSPQNEKQILNPNHSKQNKTFQVIDKLWHGSNFSPQVVRWLIINVIIVRILLLIMLRVRNKTFLTPPLYSTRIYDD